jgi:hypothetical protein
VIEENGDIVFLILYNKMINLCFPNGQCVKFQNYVWINDFIKVKELSVHFNGTEHEKLAHCN